MPDLAKSLALEVSETGLALFRCDEDIPVECLAAVERDDPDFRQKTAEFRRLAEKLVGKQVETDIWLTDDQVILRRVILDGKARGSRRAAAASALSASSAHRAEALCFDIGETGSDGYTPLAAIPKAKMEQAMAFASEMRLNPRGVTTSNDVDGFPVRPGFQPYVPPVTSRLPAGRIAAMLAVLALPVLYAIGGLDQLASGLDRIGTAGIAAVATTPVPLDERSDFTAPVQGLIEGHSSLVLPKLPAPSPSDLRPVGGSLTSVQVAAMTRAPFAMRIAPGQAMQASMTTHSFTGFAPRLPQIGPADNVSLRPGMGGMPVHGPALKGVPAQLVAFDAPRGPQPMQRAGLVPDALPHTGTIAPGPDWIDRLGPITYLASESVFDDAAAFDVANIPEGVLVRRPGARPGDRVIQPQNSPPPAARPGPGEPFADTTAAETGFGSPEAEPLSAALPALTSTSRPPVVAPVAQAIALDPALSRTIETTDEILRRNAALRVQSQDGAGISTTRPPLRSIQPAPGDPGAIIQTEMERMAAPPDGGDPPDISRILSNIVAPQPGAFGVLSPLDDGLSSRTDTAFSLDAAARLTALDRAPANIATPPLRADIRIGLEVAAALLGGSPESAQTLARPPLRTDQTTAQTALAAAPSDDAPGTSTDSANLLDGADNITLAAIARPPLREGETPASEPALPADATPPTPADETAGTAFTAPLDLAAVPVPTEDPADIADPQNSALAQDDFTLAAIARPPLREGDPITSEPALPADATPPTPADETAGAALTSPLDLAAAPDPADGATNIADPQNGALVPDDFTLAAIARPPLREGDPIPPEPALPADATQSDPPVVETGAASTTQDQSPRSSEPNTVPRRVAARPPLRGGAISATPTDTTDTAATASAETTDGPQIASARPRPARANVATERVVGGGSGGAVIAALSPIHRPASLASRAAAIREKRASVAATVAARQQPTRTTPSEQLAIPSSARVAATATIEDGIDLGDISLIGIFGKSNARRALVRSARGQIVQVKRGGRISGWTVSAIGDDVVRLQKGSQNKTLRMPSE